MYYLRKIAHGKWPKIETFNKEILDTIQADAITSDLRTKNNKLSLWTANDISEFDDIFIALASNLKEICRMDIVFIDEKELETFKKDKEDGNTPTIGINDKHINLCELNYKSLGNFAVAIANSLNKENCVSKVKYEMRELLIDAYKNNKLDVEHLNENLRKEIEKQINIQKD